MYRTPNRRLWRPAYSSPDPSQAKFAALPLVQETLEKIRVETPQSTTGLAAVLRF